MLVVLPLGLWVAALVFDLLHAATRQPVWSTLAFYDIAAGIIGALIAAVPGLIDWWTLDGRAGRLGTWHMVINLAAVGLFALNLGLRTAWAGQWLGPESIVPLVLSIVGVAMLGVSGWLGGEMVYVERVGVEEPADRRSADRRAA
jgi:uncharacterized membrane protein